MSQFQNRPAGTIAGGSRRDFLRNVAATTAAASLYSTVSVIADDRVQAPTSGSASASSAPAAAARPTSTSVWRLKAKGRCEPVAVCDVYGPRVRGRRAEDRRQDLPQLQGTAGRSARRRGVHRHARPASRPAGHRRHPRRQGRLLREAADALVADGPGPASSARRPRSTSGSCRWARSTWPTTPTPRSAS